MNSKMKVLFLTYPRIGLNRGGLQIQIEETAKALEKNGVEVVFYDPWCNQIPDVDICHVFSIDGTLVYHVTRALYLNKPVIISPVFNNFSTSKLLTKIKVELSKFIPGMYSDLKRAGIMLSKSSHVLALNQDEKNLLVDIFKLSNEQCRVIPNGIDKKFSEADPALFIKKYGVQDFILEVGSIEHRKNQFNLIKAMKNLEYKLVIVGQCTPANKEYMEKCKSIAGDNVIFIGQLSYEDPLLASAFSAAKLFVLPSYSEVMPLVILEAAIAGCKIITSKNVPISPDLEEHISIFDPDSSDEIAVLIDTEMKTAVNKGLKEKASLMPTWDDVGKEIATIYSSVLER